MATGTNEMFSGTQHKSQIQDLFINDDMLVSVAMDDTCMVNSLSQQTYGYVFCLSYIAVIFSFD